jgi:hypothetical protein
LPFVGLLSPSNGISPSECQEVIDVLRKQGMNKEGDVSPENAQPE